MEHNQNVIWSWSLSFHMDTWISMRRKRKPLSQLCSTLYSPWVDEKCFDFQILLIVISENAKTYCSLFGECFRCFRNWWERKIIVGNWIVQHAVGAIKPPSVMWKSQEKMMNFHFYYSIKSKATFGLLRLTDKWLWKVIMGFVILVCKYGWHEFSRQNGKHPAGRRIRGNKVCILLSLIGGIFICPFCLKKNWANKCIRRRAFKYQKTKENQRKHNMLWHCPQITTHKRLLWFSKKASIC